MLYKLAELEHHQEGSARTTDILITCSLGMGAAIQKTYEEGLWYGRSHPAEETMMIIRYGRSHPKRLRYGRSDPSMSHVVIIHKIATWFAADKNQGLALHPNPNKVQVQACEYMS
jgi:hypothetical protein